MSNVRGTAMLTLLLAALAAPARGQTSLTTMGRLFTTPADRMQLDQQRTTALAQGAAGNAPSAAPPAGSPPGTPPGMPADSASAAPPPPPVPVRFGGVLRRSDGRATVWVDDTPRDTVVRARPAAGAPAAGVPVDVGGRSVILKPGQSWDPATGTIQEVRRGTSAR